MDVRAKLSDLIVQFAESGENHLVLSGDHGYALFDALRTKRPRQFINAGIMEQAMVGIAAGLARTGHRCIVYGLSAFVPMRVLEQIKLDVCYSRLPVIFLGDGAGLVYSTLGASHQCGEDLAALRPLPNLQIFSPADAYELEACFDEANAYVGPSYIRIGKSDRPSVSAGPLRDTSPYKLRSGDSSAKTALVATGSMLSLARELAEKHGVPCLSFPRIKPLGRETAALLEPYARLIVLEEHSRYGGLASAIMDHLIECGTRVPEMHVLALKDQFAAKCGSWQYALSEHELGDDQVRTRVGDLFGAR